MQAYRCLLLIVAGTIRKQNKGEEKDTIYIRKSEMWHLSWYLGVRRLAEDLFARKGEWEILQTNQYPLQFKGSIYY